MNQQDSLFSQPRDPQTDKTDNSAAAVGGGDDADLVSQVKLLQHQLSTVLILLLVVSGTFGIYLFREMNMARKDLAVLRAQSQAVIAEYNERKRPAMERFVNQLGNYAKAHPDVMPILLKHGFATRTTNNAASPPAKP